MVSREPTLEEGKEPSRRTAGRGGQQASVLVVDDEPDFCQVVKEILTIDGLIVSEAHSVIQALAALAHETPDLVLTDVMMPDIDGLDLIRSLRSEPSSSAPVCWKKIGRPPCRQEPMLFCRSPFRLESSVRLFARF